MKCIVALVVLVMYVYVRSYCMADPVPYLRYKTISHVISPQVGKYFLSCRSRETRLREMWSRARDVFRARCTGLLSIESTAENAYIKDIIESENFTTKRLRDII
ncbi:uncharacterized protein LOC132707501 isoform X2 [Cylas formicarius]|uniref:uncharacterized protein LOC132707501 isoform X2 n=1 Tax=Cylas formicarius TaxID=197179 RepID=UPI002958493B|nr:uncharacterized protein LOC132707501 isoform X2 [Cylas formicarius]